MDDKQRSDAELSDPDRELEIDTEHATGPLTRFEAYMLFSKVRLANLALQTAITALVNSAPDRAVEAIQRADAADVQLEKLMDNLLEGKDLNLG